MNQVSTSSSRISSKRRPVTDPATPRGQQTRQNLLEAAEIIFSQKGYERASISAITKQAGVAQGTFYVYFADKQAIFVELVQELNHRLRRQIAENIAGLTDRLAMERAGFRAFFDYIHRHRGLYKIVRQAEFVDEELFRWYYQTLAEGYVEGLRTAMDAGQVRPIDPETLAYCLMGIGDFLGMRWVLWTEETLPDSVFEAMMCFIKEGMAPRS